MSYRRLDLNLLKVFEALMTEGTVTRAAEKLSLTQPAVSNALARLRHTFDDPLFVRSGSGVAPTQRAVGLWGTVGDALVRLRGALDDETFVPGNAQLGFSLSMSDYIAAIVMPKLLAHMTEHAPGVQLHAVPNILTNAPELLEDNRIDCLISVYVNETLPPLHIRSRALWPVEYACLMRADHPLARGGKLTVRRFLGARHVDVSLPGKTAPTYDSFLASRGLKRNLVATVNHYAVACELVRTTDLIGVLPRDLAGPQPAKRGLAALRVPLEAPERIVSLLWHQRNDTVPAHRWLREQLVALLAATPR
jgi:DNA-binding transcriptional LysR family regulator